MKRDPTDPRTWLARARSNLKRAELDRREPGIFLEDLCFDAQQAAEKALKAICVHLSVAFPKTHSLVYLIDLIEQAGLCVPEEVREADLLTRYAVETRYPGLEEEVEEAEYQNTVHLARGVLSWAEKVIAERSRTSPHRK